MTIIRDAVRMGEINDVDIEFKSAISSDVSLNSDMSYRDHTAMIINQESEDHAQVEGDVCEGNASNEDDTHVIKKRNVNYSAIDLISELSVSGMVRAAETDSIPNILHDTKTTHKIQGTEELNTAEIKGSSHECAFPTDHPDQEDETYKTLCTVSASDTIKTGSVRKIGHILNPCHGSVGNCRKRVVRPEINKVHKAPKIVEEGRVEDSHINFDEVGRGDSVVEMCRQSSSLDKGSKCKTDISEPNDKPSGHVIHENKTRNSTASKQNNPLQRNNEPINTGSIDILHDKETCIAHQTGSVDTCKEVKTDMEISKIIIGIRQLDLRSNLKKMSLGNKDISDASDIYKMLPTVKQETQSEINSDTLFLSKTEDKDTNICLTKYGTEMIDTHNINKTDSLDVGTLKDDGGNKSTAYSVRIRDFSGTENYGNYGREEAKEIDISSSCRVRNDDEMSFSTTMKSENEINSIVVIHDFHPNGALTFPHIEKVEVLDDGGDVSDCYTANDDNRLNEKSPGKYKLMTHFYMSDEVMSIASTDVNSVCSASELEIINMGKDIDINDVPSAKSNEVQMLDISIITRNDEVSLTSTEKDIDMKEANSIRDEDDEMSDTITVKYDSDMDEVLCIQSSEEMSDEDDIHEDCSFSCNEMSIRNSSNAELLLDDDEIMSITSSKKDVDMNDTKIDEINESTVKIDISDIRTIRSDDEMNDLGIEKNMDTSELNKNVQDEDNDVDNNDEDMSDTSTIKNMDVSCPNVMRRGKDGDMNDASTVKDMDVTEECTIKGNMKIDIDSVNNLINLVKDYVQIRETHYLKFNNESNYINSGATNVSDRTLEDEEMLTRDTEAYDVENEIMSVSSIGRHECLSDTCSMNDIMSESDSAEVADPYDYRNIDIGYVDSDSDTLKDEYESCDTLSVGLEAELRSTISLENEPIVSNESFEEGKDDCTNYDGDYNYDEEGDSDDNKDSGSDDYNNDDDDGGENYHFEYDIHNSGREKDGMSCSSVQDIEDEIMSMISENDDEVNTLMTVKNVNFSTIGTSIEDNNMNEASYTGHSENYGKTNVAYTVRDVSVCSSGDGGGGGGDCCAGSRIDVYYMDTIHNSDDLNIRDDVQINDSRGDVISTHCATKNKVMSGAVL